MHYSSFQCNVACGSGSQRRDIICVQKTGNDFTVAPAHECGHLEKPAAVQECEMGECEPLWFTTEWSAVRRDDDAEDVTQQMKPANSSFNKPLIYALFTLFSQCSRSCGKGLQMREVRCLAPDRKHSHECDLSTKPEQEQICNTIPCSPQVAGVCESVTTICMHMSLFLFLPHNLSSHRRKLPGQTSQLHGGGSGQDVRLHLLQDGLLRLVYPECSACQAALTRQSAQTARLARESRGLGPNELVAPAIRSLVDMERPE